MHEKVVLQKVKDISGKVTKIVNFYIIMMVNGEMFVMMILVKKMHK